MADATPRISDAPGSGRYEAHLDDVLAGVLDYVVRRDRIILVHTEVRPEAEGRGVAAALTRFALDDARRLGRRVIAACPYVKRYLARHPEDLDIVVGSRPVSSPTTDQPAVPRDAAARPPDRRVR